MDDDLPASTNLVEKKRVEWFEEILDSVGTRGKFQFRLNVYAFFVCGLLSQAGQNHYYAVFVQDHWCHVPGREFTNYTLQEWKNLTIPKLNGQYSKCRIYSPESNDSGVCQHGWDYDDTWFSVTIPSEQNWVCEKELVLGNSLSIIHGVASLLMCSLCFIGDRFGRRVQFTLGVVTFLLGRTCGALTPSWHAIFILAMIVGSVGHGPSFECIATMAIEMPDVCRRNFLNTMTMFAAALGRIVCALVAWSSGHYLTIMLATTLPIFFIICFIRWLPESPRWLVAKGRCDEAFDVLQRIAKVNGKSVPPGTMEVLQRMSKRSGLKFGIANLFKDKYLRRNTLIIFLSRFACGLTLSCLTYNVVNIPANPFVMHMAFAAVEVVSIAVTHFFVEHLGRRFTHVGVMAVSAVASSVQVLLLTVSPSSVGLSVVTVLLNMLMASSLIVAELHSLETHPTCVRQTAIAFEMIIFVAPMSVTPYLVYLHSANDGRYLYGVLGLLQLASAVATSFLPETTNKKLPQTLEDARFSRDAELTRPI